MSFADSAVIEASIITPSRENHPDNDTTDEEDTTSDNNSIPSSSSQQERHTQCCEGRVAEAIMQVTDVMLWTPLAICWIILVVITGAIFFFFMVGAITLGEPYKEDKWLNYSIQALNVLFTYAAIANQPKRCRDFIRLSRMPRDSMGIDWEGKTSSQIFDYISYTHRMFVAVNLNLNCIFQFINQTFRIIYRTPEAAAVHVLETNLFFALSFLCAFVAPIHQWRMEQRVRKEGRAPPGEELNPIQKFMGRAVFSYRELGVESYQYAVQLLNELFTRDQGSMEHDKEKNDANTDRTGADNNSQLSLHLMSQPDLETRERQDDALVLDDESQRNSFTLESSSELQDTDVGTTVPVPLQDDSPV